MKTLFVCTGVENLGTGMLSSVLRKNGFLTRLAFNPVLFGDRGYVDHPLLRRLWDRDDDLVREIAGHDPAVIVFSPLSVTYRWSVNLARRLKAEVKGARILFGGPHVSAVPEIAIAEDCIDGVGVGEGEYALPGYVRALVSGGPDRPIDNLWFKTAGGAVVRGPAAPFIGDLDSLPFADKELFEDAVEIGDNYRIMSGRGCPFRCSFCFNSFWSRLPGPGGGRYVRSRSAAHVLAELRWAKRRYAPRCVEFVDDTFTFDRGWLLEFLRAYKDEIGIPFFCSTHPQFIDDGVAKGLAAAGCIKVELGVQSLDGEVRTGLLGRRESLRAIEEALLALERHGQPYKLDHIMGLPGESPAALEQAVEFYSRFRPFRINTLWLQLYPGTELLRRAVEDGAITEKVRDGINRGEGVDSFERRRCFGDEAALKKLMRYEVIFRGMPLFGGGLARAFPEWLAPRLPADVLKVMGTGMDIAVSSLTGNPDLRIYGRYYARNMLRSLLPDRAGHVVAPRSRDNPSLH